MKNCTSQTYLYVLNNRMQASSKHEKIDCQVLELRRIAVDLSFKCISLKSTVRHFTHNTHTHARTHDARAHARTRARARAVS